mmetsp:Transcript_92071/g.204355  ORF Transcript_92071/g.204355 Transcript_92071/m.204355 type:complete len:174 (+) Transcript_92071:92-613(+)
MMRLWCLLVATAAAAKTKPCFKRGHKSCPNGITATPDTNVEPMKVQTTLMIATAPQEKDVTHYAFYWGKGGCGENGDTVSDNRIKNGHIVTRSKTVDGFADDVALGTDSDYRMPEGTTHILVFSKNEHGESDYCVSEAFEDNDGTPKKNSKDGMSLDYLEDFMKIAKDKGIEL